MTKFGLSPDVKITDLLSTKGFTLSAEIIPPRNGASPAVIVEQIESLTGAGAQFLAVTKGAGGSLRGGSLPIAQMVKDGFRKPCIAHFTCRDLLPEEVENQLIDHHFFGIRNILALRGDPPTGVTTWTPREGSHRFAYQLVEQLKALNSGKYLERPGFKTSAKEVLDFCIGVACYPEAPTVEERVGFFERKVQAGAEYAISQMLFDADAYARFLDEAAKRRVDIPVLPGARILKSQEQAMKTAKRFGVSVPKRHLDRLPKTDADAALSPSSAKDAFLALAEDLRKAGAPGMHVFVLTDILAATEALRELSTEGGKAGSNLRSPA